MEINLIWAEAHQHVIGLNGTMPWHLPEDLAHFKRVTMNSPVIMGRKTWESLPARFRPLPNRTNIVISRRPAPEHTFNGSTFDGSLLDSTSLHFVDSLQAALDKVSSHDTVWVIGGAQIYAQALPLAHQLVVTHIDAHFQGDTFAPVLGAQWRAVSRESHIAANGLKYVFVTYRR